MKTFGPWGALLVFSVYTCTVVAREGYFGFIALALEEPWGMQVLLDLGIALFFAGGWMRRDAREKGISVTPYLLALPFLGSIGALAYLVRRQSGKTTLSESVRGGLRAP